MVETRKLSNGIRVIFEKMPSDNIISIGVFVKAGSNYETKNVRGISHFIEHMLFKGTKDKSAKDIAVISDSIGGMLNAYTGKDLTCYFIKTTTDNIETAVELVSDMLINSAFDESSVQNEKKVIIEEIAMYQDSPEDYVHERLEENVWKGNSLSYPILGHIETVRSFTPESMFLHMQNFYVSENTVISVSGSFDADRMFELLENGFSNYKAGNCSDSNDMVCAKFNPALVYKTKKVEQAYLSMAFPGALYNSDERYAFSVLSGALGQSMSSRLFQIIREEKALAYNIGSSNEFYQNGGILNIFAGCNPDKFDEMMNSLKDVVEDLRDKGFLEEEIERSHEQIKCMMLLGMETTDSRMMSNGRNLLLRGRTLTRDEAIEKIDRVTSENINTIIDKYMKWDMRAISVLRPKRKNKTIRT